MLHKILRTILLRAAETIAAVALVLLFYFASLSILGYAFPQGRSLHELMTGGGWSPAEPLRPAPILDLGSGATAAASPRFVARLSDIYRRVKDKSSEGIAWSTAQLGIPLEERHAVQTFEYSGATISFSDRSQVILGENTLLVIRSPESEVEHEAKRETSILVTQGTLRGVVGGESDRPTELTVVTPAGTTKVPAGARSTDFRVTVNPDNTVTSVSYGGTLEVTSGGKTVILTDHQAVTASPSAPPGDPVSLPEPPELAEPTADAVLPFRDVPPRVRCAWTEEPRADAYRLEIARDREFREIVESERVAGTEFVHGNLRAGTYFWRVSGLAGAAQGRPSEVRRLAIVPDGEPPSLHVAFPQGPVDSETCVLHGTVERGAEVYVGKRRVVTDDSGRFECAVPLRPGLNVVVVEAMDAAGNASYRSSMVDARY